MAYAINAAALAAGSLPCETDVIPGDDRGVRNPDVDHNCGHAERFHYMMFVDSNIPMYLIGAAHSNKRATQNLLETAIRSEQRLITDVEVFQEILHRYGAIDRREAIKPAFDVLQGLVDEVFSIELSDVETARSILESTEGISSRDALHVAVMRRYQVNQIMSFDSGFDRFRDLVRMS